MDDESNPLNQISHALLQLHQSGKNDSKPRYEELRSWVNSGQVDILRFRHQYFCRIKTRKHINFHFITLIRFHRNIIIIHPSLICHFCSSSINLEQSHSIQNSTGMIFPVSIVVIVENR